MSSIAATSSRLLRSLSALCGVLVLYAAIPHLHHGAGDAPAARHAHASAVGFDSPTADGPGEVGFAADDAHETHTASAARDAHPCTLCRGAAVRLSSVSAPVWARSISPERALPARASAAARPELVFSRRHPARAPPIA